MSEFYKFSGEHPIMAFLMMYLIAVVINNTVQSLFQRNKQ